MSKPNAVIVLVIRITSGTVLIVVWIIRFPYQYIGRGFILRYNGSGTEFPPT
jgi:hypothetical protein